MSYLSGGAWTVPCCSSPGSLFTSIIFSFNKTAQVVKVVHCLAAASLHIWLQCRIDIGLETSLGTVFRLFFFSPPYLFFLNYPGVNFVMLCYAESKLNNYEHLKFWLHAVMYFCSSAVLYSSAGAKCFVSSMYFEPVVQSSDVRISFFAVQKAFLAEIVQ